jgi:hypothetical protein
MKTTLIVLFSAFMLTSKVQAQITKIESQKEVEIGKVGAMGSTTIACTKYGDSLYVFSFRNIKYQTIIEFDSFSFYDKDQAFENLYSIIIEGFEKIPEEDIAIEIPDGTLYLHYVNSMGVTSIQFLYYENGVFSNSAFLTKRQVLKLFGKK